MSALIRPSEGSAGLYTEGSEAPRMGLLRPRVLAMRERALTSFFTCADEEISYSVAGQAHALDLKPQVLR